MVSGMELSGAGEAEASALEAETFSVAHGCRDLQHYSNIYVNGYENGGHHVHEVNSDASS